MNRFLPWHMAFLITLLAMVAAIPIPVHAGATLELTRQQQTEILSEAMQAFDHGMGLLHLQQSVLDDDPALAQEHAATARAAFATAAERYQLLVDSGVDNGPLRYNLALSYLRAGQLAHAIANLQRARQWMGDTATLRRDLAYARALRDGVSPSGLSELAPTLREQLGQWNNHLSVTTRMQVLGWSWVVLWVLIAVAIFHPPLRPLARRRGLPVMVLIVVVLVVSLAVTHQTQPWATNDAVVITAQLPLRDGGGESFAAISTLTAGEELAIVHQQTHWLQVRTRDGREGWVPRQDLDIIHPRD